MGHLADIYVIQKSRSKSKAIDFLNHFLPQREEKFNEYPIPQFSGNTEEEFDNASDLMTYLETNPECNYRIYWRNKDDNNLNKHGMIAYTKDGHMIFGISRSAEMNENLNTDNEDECLMEMKE